MSHLICTWIKPLTGGWNKDTVLLILPWSWTGPYSIPILARIFSFIKEDTVLLFKGDLNTDLRGMVSMYAFLGLSPNNNKLVSATRVWSVWRDWARDKCLGNRNRYYQWGMSFLRIRSWDVEHTALGQSTRSGSHVPLWCSLCGRIRNPGSLTVFTREMIILALPLP